MAAAVLYDTDVSSPTRVARRNPTAEDTTSLTGTACV
jgi:hypothetical protein